MLSWHHLSIKTGRGFSIRYSRWFRISLSRREILSWLLLSNLIAEVHSFFFSKKETHRETRSRVVWTYTNSRIFPSNVQYYQRQSKKTARSINVPRGGKEEEEEEKQSWINTEHCSFNHSHTARWRLIYPATLHPVSRPCTCWQKQRRDKHLPSVSLLALPLSFELYKRYHKLKQKNKLLNLVK